MHETPTGAATGAPAHTHAPLFAAAAVDPATGAPAAGAVHAAALRASLRSALPSPAVASAGGERSIWHRPISYRAQCWVAWTGLTAFGLRGAAAMRHGEPPDIERLGALVLSVAWGIDLLRGRSEEW